MLSKKISIPKFACAEIWYTENDLINWTIIICWKITGQRSS